MVIEWKLKWFFTFFIFSYVIYVFICKEYVLVLSFLRESNFYLGKTKEYTSLCHTFCEAVSESEACWSLKVGVNQFQSKELYFKETMYPSLNFVKKYPQFSDTVLPLSVMSQLRHQDLTYLALPLLLSPTPLFVPNIVEPYEWDFLG